jgi:hypothetical protein
MEEEMNEDKCFLCNRDFKHKKYYKKGLIEVKEFELITHCIPCRKLLREYELLKAKLVNLEYEIFCIGCTNEVPAG